MFYRNTESFNRLDEEKTLIKTFLYYSLWMGGEEGPWYRGLVTLTDKKLMLKSDEHSISLPNEAILEVELIKPPVEVKGVSSIALTYPFPGEHSPYVKLYLMGSSTIISTLHTILHKPLNSKPEPDAKDLKLLTLLKAGVKDLRVASLILEEDIQNLYVRTARLLKTGWLRIP